MSDTTGSKRRFPETSWSAIRDLAGTDDPGRQQRLDRFLGRYWKPVFHYVRAIRPLSVADAEDITQGFFAMFLARVDLSKLTQERGSFRGFIKTALRRHIASEQRTLTARMQRGQAPLDVHEEAVSLQQHDQGSDPEEAFDRAWAREILGTAMEQLETEYTDAGKTIYFEVFRQYCLNPGTDVTYESLARDNQLSVDDVRNYLRAARGRAREIVRGLVREYLRPGETLEDELRLIYMP